MNARAAVGVVPLRSLKARLTLWYGGILAACLGAYSVVAASFFGAHVAAELDRRVHEDIELAARALVVDDAGRPHWAGGLLGKIEEETGGGHWVEVWSADGRRLLTSGTLAPLDLGPVAAETAGTRPRTLALPSGRVRVASERLELAGRHFLLRAAVSEAGVRRQVHALWLGLAGMSLTVLALGVLGGYVLSQHALGPLERMARHARRITAEQLHERLPPASSVELNQLRDAFNDTLARLERSFEQLRRFTADASHELRTPLTALRSVGEVGLRGARSADDYREIVGSMLEEADRLSRLTDELLTLARAEAGEARLRREPTDLAALARDVTDDLGVLAEERGQTLETHAGAAVVVAADRLWLRQGLLNLVDNAIKYTPAGGHIVVGVQATPTGACVAVRDNGPGIAHEHRERVFERFYRIDKSRSREMGGAGLGLALVKWVAEAHGGRVELETEVGHGSTFRVVLPRGDLPVPPR